MSLVRRHFLLGGACLAVLVPAVKMVRVYHVAQREFHLSPWQVGGPPGDLRGAVATVFPSRDGATLHAWWLPPAPAKPVVLLLHGSEADRRQLLVEARWLRREGMGVLMYDSPGLGESTGRTTWGATEPLALLGALDWVEQKAQGSRIGALGFSMGASILLKVASEDARVRAVVLEATILDMDAETRREYGAWGALSYLPAEFGKRAAGWNPWQWSPLGLIGLLEGRPVLVITGTADEISTPADAGALFAAAHEPKELLILPGAGHGGYDAAADFYGQRVVAFFEHALQR